MFAHLRLSRPGRWRAWLLVVTFLLAACSGGNGNEQSADPADVTILRFADAAYKEALYRPLIDAFQAENPGVSIDYLPVEDTRSPQTGEYDYFQLASLADAMLLPVPAGPGTGAYFLDQSDALAAAGLSAADFWPGALAGCQADGRQVGVPLYVTPTMFFANGDLLDAAGVPRPGPGWTWADFARLVGDVHAHDPALAGFAQMGGLETLFAPALAGQLPAEEGGIDAAALMATTGWYGELLQQGAVLMVDDPAGAIAAGQVALWLDSPLALTAWRGKVGDNVTLLPFPLAEDGAQAANPVQVACAAVSGGTAWAALALAWLDYLAAHPFAARWWEIPGREALATANDNLPADQADGLHFALAHAWYGPVTPAMRQVAAALGEALASDVAAGDLQANLATLPTPSPVPSPAGTPVVVGVQPTLEAGAEGVLRFFSGTGLSNKNVIRAASESFGRQTGFYVELNDYWTYLAGAPVGPAELANIPREFGCFAWTGDLPPEIAGQVVPLANLLPADLLADYEPFILDNARVEGELYGLPVSLQPQMLYYNAQRLQRRDIAPPPPAWTLAEMLDLASLMPIGEGRSQIYGFVPGPVLPEQGHPVELLLNLRGLELFALAGDAPAVLWDTPEAAEALAWLVAQAAEGIIAPAYGGGTQSGSGNLNALDEVINAGRATFWNDYPGNVNGRFGWSGASFRLGTAAMPGDAALPAPILTSLYLSQTAPDPDACLAWLVELTTVIPTAYTAVPARISVRESDGWAEAVGSQQAAYARDAVQRSTRAPVDTLLAGPLYAWWDDLLRELYAGGDPAGVLAAGQVKADAYLACMAAAPERTPEQVLSCAQQADPNYGP